MAGIVQFENVGLRYGTGAEALCDLSFTLRPGSFHFLLGPCGAGKSSLIRLILRDERPSRGIVRLFGDDLSAVPATRMPALRRRIGRIDAAARLVPNLSIADNVALPLRIAGMSAAEIAPRVAEMLAWSGIAGCAGARPARLTSAEQQRAALARAAIAGPELILADEPTARLDPDAANRLLSLFEALHRNGATVLLATSDVRLIGRVERATTMRLVRGHLGDPVGALRYPPARAVSA